MMGLDTNVIVRYLTQDDPDQSARATDAIEGGANRGDRFFITSVVLAELVWVLESAYEYDRIEITAIVEQIMRTGQFDFDHKHELWQSWQDYRAGKGDFADYVIGRLGRTAGCDETLTFDRALEGDPLFRIL